MGDSSISESSTMPQMIMTYLKQQQCCPHSGRQVKLATVLAKGAASEAAAAADLERRVREAAYRTFLRAALTEGYFLARRFAGYSPAMASCHAGSAGFTW